MSIPPEHQLAAQSVDGGALRRILGEPEEVEQRFRDIFDQAFQFICLLAPDGSVLEVNRTALEFAGAARAEVVGRRFWETRWWSLSPEARQRLEAAVAAAAHGAFVRYEVDIPDARGRTATVDFSIKPLLDESGRVLLLITEGYDITDRKRAEEALKISEAKFAGIVSIAADAIVTVDEFQRIILFNSGAETIFGYGADEVVGEPLDILIPERSREVHKRHIADFARTPIAARRMGERREIFGRRKGGELFPAEASISKIEVDGKRFFTAVLRDVSARKAVEEEMRQLLMAKENARLAAEAAERRASFLVEAGGILDRTLDYEETLSSLAELIVPQMADFCIVDVLDDGGERRRLQVLHSDPEQHGLVAEFLTYRFDPALPFLTRRALLFGESELVSEMTDDTLRQYSQSDRHLAGLRALAPTSFMSVPLKAHGRILGAIAFLGTTPERRFEETDLSFAQEMANRAALAVDNALLYEHAQRATRLRDEVLAVVSHDLRNPLSVISMCASTMLDEMPRPGSDAKAMAEAIRDSSEWMHRLIGDLLDVASIEAGHLSVDLRPIDPILAIVQALAILEPLAASQSITLESQLPEHLPRITADAERLVQVMSNLIGNAVKFTDPGGRIVVRARSTDTELRLDVCDTGRGIPPEELPHIFDRFWHFRRDSTVRGVGLGLAIAKGIVEAHGGRLSAESEPGVGSTFAFTIPLTPSTAQARLGHPGRGQSVGAD